MKQHITPKQLREVDKEKLISIYGDFNGSALNSYRKDFYDYHHKKFTIGKMIELLQPTMTDFYMTNDKRFAVVLNDSRIDKFIGKELCDTLWDALKECL